MADLQIKGVVKQLLEIKSGQTKEGKDWHKQEVIIETISDKFPKSVCIGIWNDLVKPYKIGSEITVSFNIISKEYNSKWYTEIKAWKVEGGVVANNASTESKEVDLENLPF